MQGGVADILNLVTVEIAARLPEASLVYTMHDAATWAVPAGGGMVDRAAAILKDVATRKWSIGGVDISFPAKFEKPVYGEAHGEEKAA